MCKQNEEDAFCMLKSVLKERDELKVDKAELMNKIVVLMEEITTPEKVGQ